jgi:hypothetical protein
MSSFSVNENLCNKTLTGTLISGIEYPVVGNSTITSCGGTTNTISSGFTVTVDSSNMITHINNKTCLPNPVSQYNLTTKKIDLTSELGVCASGNAWAIASVIPPSNLLEVETSLDLGLTWNAIPASPVAISNPSSHSQGGLSGLASGLYRYRFQANDSCGSKIEDWKEFSKTDSLFLVLKNPTVTSQDRDSFTERTVEVPNIDVFDNMTDAYLTPESSFVANGSVEIKYNTAVSLGNNQMQTNLNAGAQPPGMTYDSHTYEPTELIFTGTSVAGNFLYTYLMDFAMADDLPLYSSVSLVNQTTPPNLYPDAYNTGINFGYVVKKMISPVPGIAVVPRLMVMPCGKVLSTRIGIKPAGAPTYKYKTFVDGKGFLYITEDGDLIEQPFSGYLDDASALPRVMFDDGTAFPAFTSGFNFDIEIKVRTTCGFTRTRAHTSIPY